MTARTRKTPAKPKAATTPVVAKENTEAPGGDPNPTTPDAAAVEEKASDPAAPRRLDSRAEVVTVGECIVDGCPVLEFEPGRDLCMGHFTTRLDLRKDTRHD
ncbi:hypothetical protein ACIBCH_41880 [Amycolatopsis thailandensis]|uniref:hypothetical protein n=1 Tax=Amycolatopsis thailandensis TaxID=589330 RepID=UPI003795A207